MTVENIFGRPGRDFLEKLALVAGMTDPIETGILTGKIAPSIIVASDRKAVAAEIAAEQRR